MITAIDEACVELSITSPSYATNVSFQGLHSKVSNFYDTSWGYYIAGGTATIFDGSYPYGPIGVLTPPGGGASIPIAWTISTSGASDRNLADGSWDALSFGTNQTSGLWLHEAPPSSTTYAAVPEASTPGLLLLALAFLLYVRKRIHTC